MQTKAEAIRTRADAELELATLRAARPALVVEREKAAERAVAIEANLAEANFRAAVRSDSVAADQVQQLDGELLAALKVQRGSIMAIERLDQEIAALERECVRLDEAERLAARQVKCVAMIADARALDSEVVTTLKPLWMRLLATMTEIWRDSATPSQQRPSDALALAIASHLADISPAFRLMVLRQHRTAVQLAESLAGRAPRNASGAVVAHSVNDPTVAS